LFLFLLLFFLTWCRPVFLLWITAVGVHLQNAVSFCNQRVLCSCSGTACYMESNSGVDKRWRSDKSPIGRARTLADVGCCKGPIFLSILVGLSGRRVMVFCLSGVVVKSACRRAETQFWMRLEKDWKATDTKTWIDVDGVNASRFQSPCLCIYLPYILNKAVVYENCTEAADG
jgi:hypothetical protein